MARHLNLYAMQNIAACDILETPLFTLAGVDGLSVLSLPDLLARLLAGSEITSFPRLAAAQRGHLWRFLVRCASKALHERGWSEEEATKRPLGELAAAVRDTLRVAAGDPDGSRGAWMLYQAEPKQPGFLQPPTPDGEPPERKYARNTPSLLTSAIGSKNHERKNDGTRSFDAEQAAYALLDLQLGAIFGGRGNYGSQIMGSASGAGSGSPFMGARLGTGENETFRHDTAVLLKAWDRIRLENGLRGTVWALWTEMWDGESSLSSQRLDPAFIPLARLVRLGEPTAEGLFDTVWFRPSNKARVNDLTGGGNLGDPFTPRVPDLKKPDVLKVRGTLEGGYNYREIVNLLFGGDPKRPGVPSPSALALQGALHDHRSDVRVVFEGTAFEQGKTVGFYRREVLLPPSAEAWLSDTPQAVREVHGELMQRVRDVKSALNGAARVLLAGDAKPHDGDEKKVAAPADNLENQVDRRYLEVLLGATDRHTSGDETWRGNWAEQLSEWARIAFRETMEMIPTATARRYEREVHARGWLEHRLHRMRDAAGGSSPEITPDSELEESSV